MATVTDTTTLEIIGERLREARQDIHDLKTHIVGMEDRTSERFDGIKEQLDALAEDVAWIKAFLQGMAEGASGG